MMIPDSLLLVIPCVVDTSGDQILIDGDFANNLRAYLTAFSQVRVLCPPIAPSFEYSFPSTCNISDIDGCDRLSFHILPQAYREDRYLRYVKSVRQLLSLELSRYEFRLISPHSAFDWSTLAAEICIEKRLSYNMEADWNLPEVRADLWKKMPRGPNKIRKFLWRHWHDRKYYKALARSSLALLQGADVYHDLKKFAPNPHRVLNVQVGADDHIDAQSLACKLVSIPDKPTINIFYAGRASAIKGPFHWLDVITQLRDWRCAFHASWAGDGEELSKMRDVVRDRNLESVCSLLGKIERAQARQLSTNADIFMFCHLAKESPRCLVEALALGTPIVGFKSKYASDLVHTHGGGLFVEAEQTLALAELVRRLIEHRQELALLTTSAAASGQLLHMDAAIDERIKLMKYFLGGTDSQSR